MTPLPIPTHCLRCNLPLTKTVQTTNLNTEYLCQCEEPRCINLNYSLDLKFLGMTYFIAKQGESSLVSLVPLDINDCYVNLRLTIGIGNKILFTAKLPTFSPLDFAPIEQVVKTYLVFS